MVIAYKPFARGKLLSEPVPFLASLAKKYWMTDAQIVLSWLVGKPNTVALFKSMDPAHLKEDLELTTLSADDAAALDALVLNL
jgi:diketogulonate reductase-like aldo/keto reductase